MTTTPPNLFTMARQTAKAARMRSLFDGDTFDLERDGQRLRTNLERVASLMGDGQWRTLAEIATATGGSEAGVSARLRDLRKARFGGFTVARRRRDGGLWEYRVGAGA